ncbi:TorF family putative porin [Novosphingobium sp.]|uniref:TorF family putative porin n=1 Tax=Novosphingobium sp. TaxID=1874826 RepID=UPI0025DBD6FD|nr:TorF family putative porin [Novosphingobium sp.]MCC6926893.1 hypothetical protein [Novosphingobium sp.]
MNKLLLSATLAALALPCAAHAEDGDTVDLGVTLTGTTNYEWRGVSQSDNHAAVFAAVNASYKGFYLGAETENVDFAGINQEYDVWGGYVLPVGKAKIDVGFVRYGYVDAPAKIDTFEVKGAVTVPIGKASATASVYHTWNYFGTNADATYYEGALSMPVSDKISLSGAFGHQTVNGLFGYNTWNLGASYAVAKGASVAVRYHDTDDSGVLFGRLGKARIVGSFSVSF